MPRMISSEGPDYSARVQAYETMGMTTSDAQSVVDVENMYPPVKRFAMNDGLDGVYEVGAILRNNADNEEFCAWARSAKLGDTFPGQGEKCTCVSNPTD